MNEKGGQAVLVNVNSCLQKGWNFGNLGRKNISYIVDWNKIASNIFETKLFPLIYMFWLFA